MKKICCFLVVLNVSCSVFCSGPKLIDGDVYSLINAKDIEEQNTWNVNWKCLKVNKVKMACEPTMEEIEKGLPGAMPRFMVITEEGKKYDFDFRRVVPEIGCTKEYMPTWKRILKNEKVVCISAEFQTGEYPTINSIKTRKGQWSWFVKHKN
ncbi:MAG: hypothetical protein V1647_03455 [Pseudomonadota bacterium]